LIFKFTKKKDLSGRPKGNKKLLQSAKWKVLLRSIFGVGGTVLLLGGIVNGVKCRMNLLPKHSLRWRTTWKLSFGVGTVSILVAMSINKRGKDTNRTTLSKSQKVVLGKHSADAIAT
jgi:hypothetical protein